MKRKLKRTIKLLKKSESKLIKTINAYKFENNIRYDMLTELNRIMKSIYELEQVLKIISYDF